MPEVQFTYRKCRDCNGSGKKVDGDKVFMGLVSMGLTAALDIMDGDDAVSRRCPSCDGRGEIRQVQSIREER